MVKYNVVKILRGMNKPYCAIPGDNAWSPSSSTEGFNAVPEGVGKELVKRWQGDAREQRNA